MNKTRKTLISQKSISKGGSHDIVALREKIRVKELKEKETKIKKAAKHFLTRLVRQGKRIKWQESMLDRLNKSVRTKFKDLEAGGEIVPADLLVLIHDPEKGPWLTQPAESSVLWY